jgi:hypothetical protein
LSSIYCQIMVSVTFVLLNYSFNISFYLNLSNSVKIIANIGAINLSEILIDLNLIILMLVVVINSKLIFLLNFGTILIPDFWNVL